MPTRVKDLDPYEGDYVVEVAGGEHHSIARTKDGLVYCWGRNDEGQLGLGDTYGAYRREKAQKEMEEMERKHKEEAEKAAQEEAERKAAAE